MHVALRDQRRQLSQDSIYHDRSHRRAEAQDERVRVVDRVELRFGGRGLLVCVCVLPVVSEQDVQSGQRAELQGTLVLPEEGGEDRNGVGKNGPQVDFQW